MRARPTLAGSFVCLLLLAALAGTAQAQQGSQPSSDYEISLSQALDAHARGDYEAARLFMERAHELEPSARTYRGLGIVAFAQGRHLAAIRHLDASLASAEKPLPPDLRASVEELLAHAWSQVGRYELLIDPPHGDFLVDGASPDFYEPRVVVLTPGPHVITARAQGRAPYELQIDVKPGERRTLALVLAVPPAPQVIEKLVPAADVGAAHAEPALRPAWYTPTARWVGIGSGAALVITSATLWGLAYARLERVVDRCGDEPDGECSTDEAHRRFDAANIEPLAISSYVLGGAGLALLATVGSLELWQHRQRRHDVHVGVGASGVRLSGSF